MNKKSQPKKTRHPMNWKVFSISFGLILAGYLAGSFHLYTQGSCTDGQANVFKATGEDFTTHTGEENGHYYIGNEEAPVTIVEYTDYQCPFCQRYFFNTYSQIKENYIKAGAVKYIVKDLPLSFHSGARPAVYATRCAGEQDKFWEMHEKVYTYQNEWGYSDTPNEVFNKYAEEFELDTEEFSACLVAGPENFDTKINEDIAEANSKGLSGTPSFTINTRSLVGAQPYSAFSQIIDSNL